MRIIQLQKESTMHIPQNNFTNKIKPAAKFVGEKSISLAKRIVPGIVMMTCSFTIGHMMNKPSSQQSHLPKSLDANWAYQAGQQRIRDSLQIVELKQKLAADSIKIYELTKKAGLDKAIKK